MSEQSGGPGWWQASDGKWYPPQPATPVPPTPDPTQALPPVYGGAPAAPAYGAPVGAAAAAGGGGSGKVIAIVVVLALLAGGGAFLLTRGGGSGGSAAGFCDTAKKFRSDANLTNAFDDPSKVDKALAAFDQLTKAAPSEIKADMNTLNDAVKKIGQAVKSAGSDQSKQFSAILAAAASLDEKKLEAAGQHIDAFGKKNCGADFSFSEGSSSDSSTADSSSSTGFNPGSSSFDTDSFSSFDTDSLSSQFSSLCDNFSSDFGSEFCSSS